MDEIEAKKAAVAKLLEGRIVHDEQRVQVCVKGIVSGFPATLEAVQTGYPFGVNYFLETKVVEDPGASASELPLKLVITPRVGRGLFAFLSRLLLMEARGMKVDIPRVDAAFVCSFNDTDKAKSFLRYPTVDSKLLELAKITEFTELLVKTDAGICLSQPQSFASLNIDVCKETFAILGELGQVVFEAFS